MRPRILVLLVLIFVLSSCVTAPPAGETPAAAMTATPAATPLPQAGTADAPEAGPVTLRVWIPPQFDPASETFAAALFRARLNEFAARKQNVQVEVRIKDVDGPGGILDTLRTASAAAPAALPDLVALPRHGMETAAADGVLHAFDGLTTVMDDPDWYSYARQLAHTQNAVFGIPFAGDALLMVYRPAEVAAPPLTWDESLAITATLAFPAADPKALVTLLHYQSLGGSLVSEEQVTLDEILLTEVLTYYQQASAVGLMPDWVAQFETDAQSWEAYQAAQANLAIAWASRPLTALPEGSAAAPIPTFDGTPFTLADGWVWSLTATDPDRQLLAAQLAEFLTTGDYLAAWTEAAGVIPPRPGALANWENEQNRALLEQIAPAAQLIPSMDVIIPLGAAIQPAVTTVIEGELDPLTAAQNAAAKLTAP